MIEGQNKAYTKHNRAQTYNLVANACVSRRSKVVEKVQNPQCAKIPFLPPLEKLAAKLVLYGVLSLLKRTCSRY